MVVALARSYEPLHAIEQIDAYEATLDFKLFLRLAWPVIEPATRLLWNWHIDALAEHLQAVHDGKLTRLLINIAPGHAKSSIVSTLWPMWCWLTDPSIRWLCASHSLDLAIRDNRNCRLLIESEWFQARYGHLFALAGDQNVKGYFANNHLGYRMAVAVRGSGTGKRGTRLHIDDANNAMAGEADIEAVIEWFGKTWTSRLNDQENGAMTVVGQRLHAKDLSAHILSLGNWEHLNLPEEFEPSRRFHTSIGWTDKRTEAGELLWPEKFTRQVLDKLKRSLGSTAYAAQYQQNPVPSEGGKFRKQWFRYYSETEEAYILHTPQGDRSILKSVCWKFGTSDLAISSKQDADYTVFAVWAVTPDSDLILVDLFRDRIDNAEQVRQIAILQSRHTCDVWKVETVAYQLAFFQQALKAGVPCQEFKPVRDKVSRATTAAVWMENGKFFFSKNAPYLNDLETELLLFPKGEHDDIVDNHSIAADVVCSPQVPLAGEPESTPHEPEKPLLDELQRLQRDPFKYAQSLYGEGW